MANIKSIIKNDMWRYNYIIPFIKKYRGQDGGIVTFARKSISELLRIRVVKGKPRCIENDIDVLLKNIDIQYDADDFFFYYIDEKKTIAVEGNVLNNFTVNYANFVNKSLLHTIKRIKENQEVKRAEVSEKIYNSLDVYIKRILSFVDEHGDGEAVERIHRMFDKMLTKPAEHFEEGLQRILFLNQILWQTRHRQNGLGRLDKILFPLYQNDINNGMITKKSASEMIDCFIRCLSRYYVYKSEALLGDIGQIIVLGGNEPDGTYCCNELTYLFLSSQARNEKPDPKTFLRIGKNMPRELMAYAVSCLAYKTGSPLFSNDERVIPALQTFGIDKEDSYNYAVSACWEPLIPGKAIDQNNIEVLDFFQPLERVFTIKNIPTDYQGLLSAYFLELKVEIGRVISIIDSYKWAHDPIVTLFMDDTEVIDVDVSEGGAKYSHYGITTVGMSSVVDSMLILKNHFFNKPDFSNGKVYAARQSNFLNNEALYLQIKNYKKYYAHDKEEAEKLVNTIIGFVNDEIRDYKNYLGGKLKFGLSSPAYIMRSGKSGADFAGRKKGDPYPVHISGMDVSYTELVNFAGRLNYSEHGINGNVVDYFVSPELISNNKNKFVQFLISSIAVGFYEMQMNIMDSKTLIDAKKHPEKYPGLIVRVWGFSSYFVDLPEKYKDLLIERALESETCA